MYSAASRAKLGELDLVGRGADADGDAVGLALGALEVADEEGDEVGRHLGRGGEGEGVFAGDRRVCRRSELVLEMTVSRLVDGEARCRRWL